MPMIKTPLDRSRWFVIAIIITLLFSPPLTNLAELLLAMTIIFNRDLRSRVMNTRHQSAVIWLLAFYVLMTIGMFYSIGPTKETFNMWSGWKKLLFFPVILALFDDIVWKRKAIEVFIGVSAVTSMVSFILAYFNIYTSTAGHELGVIVRNHSTQGMFFSIAAFSAATLLYFEADTSISRKIFLLVSSLLLVANIIFISTGRSGYLVLVICSLSLLIGVAISRKKITAKFALTSLTLISLVVVGLAVAPSSNQRIKQAVYELENAQNTSDYTSMGIRVIFWENTIKLIKKHPIIGYGTGAFEAAYTLQVEGGTGLNGLVTADPHNQFMKIMGENGLIGLILFLGFLISVFRMKASTPYLILGLGAASAWIATSMANSHFSTFSEGTFIYVWLAVMLANESA
jgi:O-antigen ligase